jgi:hypothetical protein
MLIDRLITIIICGLLTVSCAVIKDTQNREFIKLEKADFRKLNGEFSNYPTTSERIIVREMVKSNYDSLTLWDQIGKHNELKSKVLTVTLDFESKTKAIARLWDSGELKQTKVVRGRIKNGYFYRRPFFVAIPLVPVVFGYNTYRYRIGLTKDSIIIDYKWNYYGFLVMAGSYSEGQTSSTYEKK